MTQPDKLFKDKLEAYESPAPLTAWSRIESNLDNRRGRGLWMKIAAGLILLAIAGVTWFASTENNRAQNQNLALNDNPVVNDNTNKSEDENTVMTIPETAEVPSSSTVAGTHENSKEPAVPGTIHPVKLKITEPMELVAQAEEPLEVELPDLTAESVALSSDIIEDELVTTSVPSAENNVIVYTADEVNAKFLKKNSLDATSDDKKPSGIQRLITMAADLKHTEGGLGELRDKKNELLALNFRKNNEVKNN